MSSVLLVKAACECFGGRFKLLSGGTPEKRACKNGLGVMEKMNVKIGLLFLLLPGVAFAAECPDFVDCSCKTRCAQPTPTPEATSFHECPGFRPGAADCDTERYTPYLLDKVRCTVREYSLGGAKLIPCLVCQSDSHYDLAISCDWAAR